MHTAKWEKVNQSLDFLRVANFDWEKSWKGKWLKLIDWSGNNHIIDDELNWKNYPNFAQNAEASRELNFHLP